MLKSCEYIFYIKFNNNNLSLLNANGLFYTLVNGRVSELIFARI